MNKKFLYLLAVMVFGIIGLTGRSIYLAKAIDDGAGHEAVQAIWASGKLTFTSLASTTIQVVNTAGAFVDVLNLTGAVNSVNYLDLASSATGNVVILTATGTDSNIGLTLTSKGTGSLVLNGPSTLSGIATLSSHLKFNTTTPALYVLNAGGSQLDVFDLRSVNTAVNNFQITNSATGNDVTLETIGTDTNIDMALTAKGKGRFLMSGSDLTLGATKLTIYPVETAPAALTAGTPTTGGAVTTGTHSYKVTCVTPEGETTASVASNVITTDVTNMTVPLSSIPICSGRTTARRIYRTEAGGANYLYLVEISDNSTTIYSDIDADGGLGGGEPSGNGTSNVYYSLVSNANTVIAHTFDTSNNITASGAKLVSWKNQGVEQAGIDKTGSMTLNGITANGSVLHKQGNDVVAGAIISLGTSGNIFEITTGTPTIDLISNITWQNGSEITLIANEGFTITHASSTIGTDITILLSGSGNFVMTPNDTLTLILSETTASGQAWREKSRTSI